MQWEAEEDRTPPETALTWLNSIIMPGSQRPRHVVRIPPSGTERTTQIVKLVMRRCVLGMQTFVKQLPFAYSFYYFLIWLFPGFQPLANEAEIFSKIRIPELLGP